KSPQGRTVVSTEFLHRGRCGGVLRDFTPAADTPRPGGCSVRRLRAGVLVLLRVAAAHIAAVVERRIAVVVGGHCAFTGGLGFLGVSIHGHIVVGRDPLEPLLGSLRTALFLGLGADADSGRVDLLLGVVVLSCCAVRQILLFVAHGVPLFRMVVGDGRRRPVYFRTMIVTGTARSVVS